MRLSLLNYIFFLVSASVSSHSIIGGIIVCILNESVIVRLLPLAIKIKASETAEEKQMAFVLFELAQ